MKIYKFKKSYKNKFKKTFKTKLNRKSKKSRKNKTKRLSKKGGIHSCNDPNNSIYNTNLLSLFPYKPIH